MCMSLEPCPSDGWACGQIGDPRSPGERGLLGVRRHRKPGDPGVVALAAGMDGEAQDVGPPVAIQSGPRDRNMTSLAAVSLKVSRAKLLFRPARAAGCGADRRLCAPGSRGGGRAPVGRLRELGGRGSSAPPPGQARVLARSSSATGSCPWCDLSGW